MEDNHMRIFLAGATGVIGSRLLSLMSIDGHAVAAMTRTPGKMNKLLSAGAVPILCDLFDRTSLIAAVMRFRPDVVLHQVTDLPDEIGRLPDFIAATDRVRSEGTRNLLVAAQAANASGFIAQSIAWDGGPVVKAHEEAVILAGGTILRYGRFYGPGTYYQNDPPPSPRIHIEKAARETIPYLVGPRGIFTLADDFPT
jgi:uncharacterized protein YbjT (DUF2867 family)